MMSLVTRCAILLMFADLVQPISLLQPRILIQEADLVQPISLLQPRILIQEGASFFQLVEGPDFDISICTATFKQNGSDVIVHLDMHNTNVTFSNNFTDTIDMKNRLQSLGVGRCGFKIDNTTINDPKKWFISVSEHDLGRKINSSFTVDVYKQKKLQSTQRVTLGNKAYIKCGDQNFGAQRYCHMYNPKGELVTSGIICSYAVLAAVEDLGTWKCVAGVIQATEALKYTVKVLAQARPTSEDWIVENEDFVSFGCRVKNWKRYNPPTYCIMTSPIGEKFLIRPGHATPRYTSIYSNLKENICAIEISKPLLDSEQGLWTCEIDNRGRILQVGKKNDSENLTNFNHFIKTELKDNFVVKCKVPYSNAYCFIIAPNGQRYEPDTPSRSELGECYLSIRNASTVHNGTWLCYFIRDDEVVAVQQKFEVVIANNLTCTRHISMQRENEITMSCNTGRTPVEYCWYISPTGNTYHLKNKANNSDVSYFGKGLEFGDCGIRIHKTKDTDQGNWTCIVKFANTVRDNKIQVTLLTEATSVAGVMGASIGVSLLSVVSIVVFVYTRKRRAYLQCNENNTSTK